MYLYQLIIGFCLYLPNTKITKSNNCFWLITTIIVVVSVLLQLRGIAKLFAIILIHIYNIIYMNTELVKNTCNKQTFTHKHTFYTHSFS